MTPRERGEWFMQQQQELTTALTKEWVGYLCWAFGVGCRISSPGPEMFVSSPRHGGEEGLLM